MWFVYIYYFTLKILLLGISLKKSFRYEVFVTFRIYPNQAISTYVGSFKDFNKALMEAIYQGENSKYSVLDTFVFDSKTKEVYSCEGTYGSMH